jgi:hypothetical protein
MDVSQQSVDSVRSETSEIARVRLKLVSSAVAGVLLYFFLAFFWPKAPPQSVLHSPELPNLSPAIPLFLQILVRASLAIRSAYVTVPWFLVMAYQAVFKSNAPGAWICAFLAGFGLPVFIFHVVLHWR